MTPFLINIVDLRKIRLRRSSDDEERDFSQGEIDRELSILEWAAGAKLYVVKFYHDLEQFPPRALEEGNEMAKSQSSD